MLVGLRLSAASEPMCGRVPHERSGGPHGQTLKGRGALCPRLGEVCPSFCATLSVLLAVYMAWWSLQSGIGALGENWGLREPGQKRLPWLVSLTVTSGAILAPKQ